MKTLLATVLLMSAGCGYIDGPCWRRSEESAGVGAGSGVGGGPILPGGVGGYGDSYAEPQNVGSDEDMPIECWTEGCKDGCDRQREEDLNTCQKIPAQKQAGCRQRAKDKAAACHRTCNDLEKCYDECDAKADEARKLCNDMPPGPGQARCYQAVQEQWSACYTECRKKHKK